MFKKDKLIKHFTKLDNAIIYALIILVFTLEILDEGIVTAVLTVTVIGYLLACIVVVMHFTTSIRFGDVKYGMKEILSYTYCVLFISYGLYEIGFQRKAIVLLIPFLLGLIIALASLFMSTKTYSNMNKWENNKLKSLGKWFKRKT